ncbi:MAG: hypothetical protein ACJAWO_000827 [Halieaceae bacterium]|jgi:hypothetical protein
MNSNKIIALFESPSLLHRIDVKDLNEIIEIYPYFNQARLLLTKKMQQTQHLLLKKEIKRTAVSVPNRKGLYEFLYQKDIHSSIINSVTENESKLTANKVAKDVTEKAIANEVSKSSFVQPVAMERERKPEVRFKQPIDLKSFGTKESKTLDILEQQIIGQTIEHVLSQEIESSNAAIVKTTKSPTNKEIEVNETQKFSDWLTILDQDRLKNWRDKDASENTESGPTENDIIDSFLQKDTNVISPTNDNIEFTPSNLARLSIVDDEDFVTETLADIYLTQGNLPKALSAYNKLLLKYPKKKTYFAARIDKIERDLK